MLALDWGTPVDLDQGTIWIHRTVTRVTSVGLKEHGRDAPDTPSDWVMAIWKRRYEASTSEWCVPSSIGTLRDPDNT